MIRFKQFLAESLDKPTYGLERLAKKHGVSVASLSKQLAMGMAVEKEHTSDPEMAKEIALDHIAERPDYYTRLKKVEEEHGAGEEGTKKLKRKYQKCTPGQPVTEAAPPGPKAEAWIKANKRRFVSRYGEDGEKILYAKAWKLFGQDKD